MNIEPVLKVAVIVLAFLLLVLLCFKLIIKESLSNLRFFANFSKGFYNYFYSIKKINHLRTNNFGYAPVDREIAGFDPDLQFGLQLYKELVKNGNGYLMNENCSVVEVGCGKGAGAQFLIEKFKPQKYIGVDFSYKAIGFCTDHYQQLKNAFFVCADAQQLPFPEGSTDLVLNVESSHLYKDTIKFFAEVHRILKANGKFLFTDYRCVKDYPIERLEKEIQDAGFAIAEKKTITPYIRNACMLASERREKLVEEVMPWYLRKYFRHYAVLTGTKKFNMMENGEIVYMMYHLEKSKTV